ncbi:MAG: hypothetical protein LBB79_07155 [Prevotellaceae bacterium]|jgi:IS5 family transposase|nr:hypothetical protein [Prevotellaceae bacterium]
MMKTVRMKDHFGSKVGLIASGKKGKKIILAIQGFLGNPFGGHTIAPLLNQMQSNGLELPKSLVYDRGGKGQSAVAGVTNHYPIGQKKSEPRYRQEKKRGQCRARAAIER